MWAGHFTQVIFGHGAKIWNSETQTYATYTPKKKEQPSLQGEKKHIVIYMVKKKHCVRKLDNTRNIHIYASHMVKKYV